MIIVYHFDDKITEVVSLENQKIKFDCTGTISAGLIRLADAFSDEKIVWCHSTYKEHLAVENIDTLLHHNKMMLSFRPKINNFFEDYIGYVEESLFINVNKKVSYPTWQMSSYVGVIHASVLNAINDKIVCDPDFDYYLNSMAKLCMPLGLLCYSEPHLLKSVETNDSPLIASSFTLFRFVKQHYKTRWVFLLALNLFLYERKILFYPFISALFSKRRINNKINLDGIVVQSSRAIIGTGTIDVIIPTIGRSSYLYDVLKDFSKQSVLPDKIIVVEQNPEPFSKTELDYIETENWPFEIRHVFTHQAGACSARNLALNQTTSEWVFLADDDNRFDSDLFKDIFKKIKRYGCNVVTTAYPQKGEGKLHRKVVQWSTFGAGNSFLKRIILQNVKFDLAFEFGYGEDSDFGMQLRNQGHDVLFLPEPSIMHLKAPVGGFRTKPQLRWYNETIQPKPSPTIMLYLISYKTKQQTLGYKTTLFFKYYKHQNIRNPFNYLKIFKKQWNQSVYWANELKKES
ncbi:glycosyltransferase family 2 protein [Flavobacterium sp. LB2P44]|uniref:glycosyltransferase family 2 protein n=1 Tax=Flavobacterium sp. LB2P44 TaxID=3401713 RepID=UPI003AAE8E9C